MLIKRSLSVAATRAQVFEFEFKSDCQLYISCNVSATASSLLAGGVSRRGGVGAASRRGRVVGGTIVVGIVVGTVRVRV